MKLKLLVDPPSGWQYGFPRPYDFKPSRRGLTEEEYKAEQAAWFRSRGYPQALIDQGMLMYCRFLPYDGEER